jgi:UDP-glucose 4-epimerase
MKLHGKNILVTGGAGFIGSHLVEHLIERGLRVTVLDNFRQGRLANLAPVADSPRLRVIHGDITDLDTCHRACRDVDVVFHLAALGVRHSLHNPVENHQVNALGSLYLLQAARAARTPRFVYMSTSEVYGRTTEFPIRESTPTWPLTVYGSSKLAGEHYAASYFESFGLPTIRVRPFNNYGPRSHFEGDSGEVIPRFILRALAGQPPVIFGDGRQTRDFLHVRDCAEALAQIAECDALVGQVVNLGYGEEVRIRDIAKIVLKALGREDLKPVHEKPRPADVPRLWVDNRRLRSIIKFRPKITLADGIESTADYFREVFARDPHCLDQMTTRNWEVK